MRKSILSYLKHVVGTILVLALVGIAILLSEDGGIHYGDNSIKMNWENEGPYIFYKNDSTLSVKYIKGDQDDGFYLDVEERSAGAAFELVSHFNLDSSAFSIPINPRDIATPKSTYEDGGKIFAVSDIESGYKAFRDLLVNSGVINENLNWSFEDGHLVLVGDFVDRGFSTTQTLWFIYKMEQDAKKHGGQVHFILGNHEIKNMQADYGAASPKYQYVASILEKQQHELYDQNSFIGKWMSSKNTVELINGVLFTHGGIHPEVAEIDMDLDEINKIVRSRYYLGYYSRKEKTDEQLLISTSKGPSWYRGYYRDDELTQEQVDQGLDKFNARAIVVGHTIQSKVNRSFEGKVIGIDVQHPKDYHKNWPDRKSEALLIDGSDFFRVLANGEMKEI